jgi:outer membrane protein OmpA-like peptidoglycan-associated protein
MCTPRRRAAPLHSLVPALAVALAAGEARAQVVNGQFALDRFEPTPVGDSFYAVPGGEVLGHLTVRGGIVLDYAHNPLVLRTTSCASPSAASCMDSGVVRGAVVGNQFVGHAGLSLALWNRLLVSLEFPITFVASGDDPNNPKSPSTVFASPHGAAAGDLRIGARVNLFSHKRGFFDIAAGGYLWTPTGKPAAYTSDGSVRGMPQLSASGRAANFVWAADMGVMFRRSVSDFVNLNLGHELVFGAAAGFMLAEDRLQLGPELYGTTVISNGTSAFAARTTDAELLAAARVRLGSFVVGAGAGPGLTRGVGAPAVRVLATFAYSPGRDTDEDGILDPVDACPQVKGVANDDPKKHGCPPDRDGDGIVDANDACPDIPGIASDDPKKNGCPPDRDGDGIADAKDACPDVPGVPDPDAKKNGCPPDRDGDGIADAKDACPDIPGVASDDPKKNGCPPDRDGDGIADAKDACPDVPGVPDPDPKKNGCPGDRDGDGITDDVDACPNEKGAPDPDPKQNGCPKFVRVTKTQIKILQQVQFEFAKARIKRESDALLGEVAGVMKQHPEIKKIRVEGHTDTVGSDAVNRKLSDDRAKAVMKWLIDHGVEASRLVAQGFGKDRPIADNASKEGRQINRRVEFNIIDPPPEPEPPK